jgi:histidinol-phosphate aminotransferase
VATDFYALAAPGAADLTPYRPGKPASELQRELGLTDIVSLASNENPLGPSPVALAAAQDAITHMTRYPDPAGFALKAALSERYGIPGDWLTLGNGSNELLNLVARVFVQPGDEVIYSQYAFVVFSLAAKVVNGRGIEVPARDYGHDLEAMALAITERTRVIYLASPNNPTGTGFSQAQFLAFMAQVPPHVVVVLDEAYTEYVDAEAQLPNGLELLRQYANLVVTRTFSKAYGLAGLRVGFAAANPQITDLLNRVREPFNVNMAALAAAQAVLTDEDYLARAVAVNRAGMQQLREGFTRLGLSSLPSYGNFLTLELDRPAQPVFDALLREGVIVRPLQPYGMERHLRISVGLEHENRRCLAALEKVLSC